MKLLLELIQQVCLFRSANSANYPIIIKLTLSCVYVFSVFSDNVKMRFLIDDEADGNIFV